MTQEGSRTLILVCRRDFARIIERVLRCEGFRDFRHGRLSLVGDTPAAARGGASEVFVLATDGNSAKRLAVLLRACPLQGSATDLFELYTIDHGWSWFVPETGRDV